MTNRLAERIPPLDAEVATALAHGQFGDPFSALGPHRGPDGRFVRVFLPGAKSIAVLQGERRERTELTAREPAGLFEGAIGDGSYLLSIS